MFVPFCTEKFVYIFVTDCVYSTKFFLEACQSLFIVDQHKGNVT